MWKQSTNALQRMQSLNRPSSVSATGAVIGRAAAAAAASFHTSGITHSAAASTRRASGSASPASAAKPLPARKKWRPEDIYPSQAGHVRIINNTTRDAQQSNLSAEMAAVHRYKIARLIDDCYKNIEGPPGVEQVWGGTIPMFDLWKRGAHPFDGLRTLTRQLPNTPVSCLVRSNSLNSMNAQPADSVDTFIRLSCEAGMNVFTNFDANNDPRNHRAVAEAVHKHGGHYQAALSWAVYHPDPTIYNPIWAVNWFKRIVRDFAPHSLYVKDPSGVLTPEMAGILAAEIKAEFPKLPLIFHAHYQTGFAYASYLEALKNGANGVECSLGFPDGAGQPYGLTMLRMAEDFGMHTGNPNKQAWEKISDLCKNEFKPLYPAANVVRTPDIKVEMTGIAGGQRSILDKELVDAGMPHLIPRVDSMVQQVRKEGGLVCQVTPAADSYAREAMRRIRGGDAGKMFVPGYAQILFGEQGSTKEPVNAAQRAAALDERAHKRLGELVAQGVISDRLATEIESPQGFLRALRTTMDGSAKPVWRQRRIEELEARLEELRTIAAKPSLASSLSVKIRLAQRAAAKGTVESTVGTIDDRVKLLQAELDQLRAQAQADGTSAGAKEEEDLYHSLLLGTASDADFRSIAGIYADVVPLAAVKSLASASGAITCSASLLLKPSLVAAREELEKFEAAECLGLLDTPQKAEENTLLWACFAGAAIPRMLQNFFRSYYSLDVEGHFPKLFKGDKDGHPTWGKAKQAHAEQKQQQASLNPAFKAILAANPALSKMASSLHALRQSVRVYECRQRVWSDRLSLSPSSVTSDSDLAARWTTELAETHPFSISAETRARLDVIVERKREELRAKQEEFLNLLRNTAAAQQLLLNAADANSNVDLSNVDAIMEAVIHAQAGN